MDRTGIGLLLVCLLCVSPCVLGQDLVNVAPGKTCRQSTTYGGQVSSCNAANGNTGGTYVANGVVINCIHTLDSNATYLSNFQWKNDYTPWWEVDLGRTYPVRDIKVWARTNLNRRLYPFNITVDGQLCARIFDDGNRERSVRCSSVMYGQVVRLTKHYTRHRDNQFLNLCELEVLVPSGVVQCAVGRYGPQCGQNCASDCGGGYPKNICFQDTGICYFVCQSGDYMLSDNTCVPCSTNCDRGCDRYNGKCDGCTNGYYGDKCARQCTDINPGCVTCGQDGLSCSACKQRYTGSLCSGCVDGRHGARCDYQCTPSGCLRCGQNTGRCEACKANLNLDPPSCTDCADGFSKHNTNTCTRCSQYCKDNCDNVSGACDNGCVDGRHGDRCDKLCTPSGCLRCEQNTGQCETCKANLNLVPPSCTECQASSYRRFSNDLGCTRCTWTCYNNTSCDKSTGHCSRCQPGYRGNTCQTPCGDGWYGDNCTAQCGSCEGGVVCNKSTGHCPCPVGKQPPLCDTDCKDNKYGKDCLASCGQCQGEQPCDTVTGECPADCLPGWVGARCDENCKNGTFGERCNKTCGHCEVNTTCHHVDGHCLANCASGFTGPSCLQEAKPATSQENKDDGATNLVGPMVGAIVGVGLVMTISITAAICWRRKSATSRSSGQDPTTTSSISVKDAAPTVSPEPSPLRQSSSNEDNLYSEIRDPDDTYEISEMQSIYDKPSPYSNDDGDREPYMQLTSKTNDVNIPASNAAYVNTKLSV